MEGDKIFLSLVRREMRFGLTGKSRTDAVIEAYESAIVSASLVKRISLLRVESHLVRPQRGRSEGKISYTQLSVAKVFPENFYERILFIREQ